MNKLLSEVIQHKDYKCKLKHLTKKYKATETIMEQGKLYPSIYLIKSGKVRVVVHASIKEHSCLRPGIDELGEDNIVGEFHLEDDLPSRADIIAMTDCELIEIDVKSLRDLIDYNPQIGSRILVIMIKSLTKQLHHANRALYVIYSWGMKAHNLDKHLE